MTDFEALVRRHQAAVCATAYAVLRDRARSEDIAQDAFLLAWQKLPALDPAPPLPAWICGIAKNLARNAARKHRETAMTHDHADLTSPLDAALRREHVDLANRALASLPEADRELVVLYYRVDESIAEVAGALAIPEATARKRLSRTRARLRDALAAVEAMLRATRPGPAFTVACVAALTAGRVPEAAAATPTRWAARAGISGAALAVVVGGVVLVARRADSPATSTATLVTSDARATDVVRSTGGLRRISPADRAAMLARLRSARITAPVVAKVYDFADVSVDTPPTVDAAPITTLSKRTLRRAIAQLHPMLRACTDGGGRLAVKLRLVGEARGTLVESVEITGDPPLSDDAEVVDCIRTTLETLELPAMDDTQPWDVYYPFVF